MAKVNRLSQLLAIHIPEILNRGVNDARIGFVSITGVEISDDQLFARVYYSQIGDEDQKRQTRRGFSSARPYIQSELAKRLKRFRVPKLQFRYDGSLERGSRLIEVMDDESSVSTD